MKKIRFGDILILISILCAGILLIYIHSSPENGKVIVTADGKRYEYSLSQENTYSVPGLLGNTTFEIKNNKVRIIDSPCPNKTCIGMGWSDLLICLPNQVFISIEETTNNKGELDAITK